MADEPKPDEYDLSNLDPEDAKEYIVAVMATLKQTVLKRKQLENDLELWERRVDLAVENGRSNLVEGAKQKVEQLKEDIGHLSKEETEYNEGLTRMKRQWKTIQSQPKLTVDVDLLTAQMDMLLGEQTKAEAETNEKLRKAEADQALEELRQRMNKEE
jgi:phage shock protein A